MRWKTGKVGDHRIKEGFLWFPKNIQGETRWLEYCIWEEIFQNYQRTVTDGETSRKYIVNGSEWRATQWLTPKRTKKKLLNPK